MRGLLAAGLVLALGAGPLRGQDDAAGQPERLFRDRTPLELTIRAPFPELFKDRDTLETKPVSGTIELVDEKRGAVSLPLTLETRGHFRLKRTTCAFTPLKVRVDKEQAKGTLFGNQGSLKLVTHCQGASRYEQNLLVEEGVYRMYNILTPLSHRTRLARIRYVTTSDTTKVVTRYGFLIEDDEEMAKRNNGRLLMQTGGTLNQMDPEQMDLVSVFQYMIGNTDWSVFAIHNIRIVDVQGGEYQPVAYDFDFSGLVGSSYASPDYRLPIKTVKERLYRGPCRTIEDLTPTLERFTRVKDSLYAALSGVPGLEPRRVREATDYLEGFFERIRKPRDFDDALGHVCRGR
jgi:hypothetical protein